jgi:hypothetical protein
MEEISVAPLRAVGPLCHVDATGTGSRGACLSPVGASELSMEAAEYGVRWLHAAVMSEVAAAGSGSVRQRQQQRRAAAACSGGVQRRRAALLRGKGRHVEGGDENICQRYVRT